jgi:hypothetical protein
MTPGRLTWPTERIDMNASRHTTPIAANRVRTRTGSLRHPVTGRAGSELLRATGRPF